MKHFLTCFLLLLSLAVFAQEKNLAYYYNAGMEAYRAKDFSRFYEMMKEANAIHPYHQGVLYQLGMAAALTGRKEEAVTYLKKAILIDASFRLESIADFNAIKDTKGFREILMMQKEYNQPVIRSDTAFILQDRRLHVEGIDYEPKQDMFYLGSIHQRKIVKVTSKGEVTDFCAPGFEGMTSVLGIKVDGKKNQLWVCSSPMAEMEDFDSAARSAVYKFQLSSGKLLEKFQRPVFEKDGVFGDLALNSRGEVFISDSQTNSVFTVNEKTHRLDPYFTSPDFWNIQGLSFSDHDQYLFIADYIKGIFRLDTKTKLLQQIECDLDVSLKGIDGLTWYHQGVIAIQNGVVPARVVRYFLNPAQTKIIRSETLDRKHPAFNEPTMGVMRAHEFFYIGNSQWSGYTPDHHIKPDDQLQDIVILKTKLVD